MTASPRLPMLPRCCPRRRRFCRCLDVLCRAPGYLFTLLQPVCHGVHGSSGRSHPLGIPLQRNTGGWSLLPTQPLLPSPCHFLKMALILPATAVAGSSLVPACCCGCCRRANRPLPSSSIQHPPTSSSSLTATAASFQLIDLTRRLYLSSTHLISP